VAALLLPGLAWAASPSSQEASRTYNLNWTLPTAGKSGCMVCHGDPGLQKTSGETTTTLYVDQAVLDESAHAEALCTGCHVDFAVKTPHQALEEGYDWRKAAATACQSCKDHEPQRADVSAGSHSSVLPPGVTQAQAESRRAAEGKPVQVPSCGQCHGGHAVPSKEDTEALVAFKKSAIEVCGGCHTQGAETYADYYHGAAYQEGAPYDAPTCWDCHGAHQVLPASDRDSPIHPDNLVAMCGQEGCHIDVNENFVEYASLIHGRQEALEQNPLWSLYDSAKQGISAALENFKALFK